MKKAVIFGATGGIGKATCDAFIAAGYLVKPVGSKQIDFAGPSSQVQISELLEQNNPNVIVNCAGYFDNGNTEDHFNTMNINVGSNWSIIKHYIDNTPKHPVKIIMIGSSAYKAGRKDYILYAASKSALYNMWQGASEYFSGSNVNVGLINPVRTRTPMIDMTTTAVCLEPVDVATTILNMASINSFNLIDMKYPEETK